VNPTRRHTVPILASRDCQPLLGQGLLKLGLCRTSCRLLVEVGVKGGKATGLGFGRDVRVFVVGVRVEDGVVHDVMLGNRPWRMQYLACLQDPDTLVLIEVQFA